MIVLCMTPRSGSTHLGSLMKANGLGVGSEHFSLTNPNAIRNALGLKGRFTYDQYLRGLIERQTQNGIFCVKTDWQQYIPVYYSGSHQHYFATANFIYLTRDDVLMQAISRYVATKTKYFHSTNVATAHTTSEEVEFDFEALAQHLRTLIEMQSAWEQFFGREGLRPLKLSYEELSSDPAGVLSRISNHVGIPIKDSPRDQSIYKIVRNERNEELRDRFIEESRRRRDETIAQLIKAATPAKKR